MLPDLKSGPLLEDLIPLAPGVAVGSEVEQMDFQITLIGSSNNLIKSLIISPLRRKYENVGGLSLLR